MGKKGTLKGKLSNVDVFIYVLQLTSPGCVRNKLPGPSEQALPP